MVKKSAKEGIEITVKNKRTENMVELLKYSTEAIFKIPVETLEQIASPVNRLRFDDSICFRMSKKVDEDFLIHILLDEE